MEPEQVQTDGLDGQATLPATASEGALTPGVARGDTINVPCPAPSGLTPIAETKYRESIRKYAVNLSNETARLELAARSEDEDFVEVTADMVVKANDVVRNPPQAAAKPMPHRTVWCPIAAVVCTVVAGIFGNQLPAAWAWVGLVASGIATVVFMAWPFYELRRRP